MNYLSICSGIEAATVAWHPLGWTPVAFAEIEAFPSAVLAHHYPDVPNLGDLTQYRTWPAETLAATDVLVGGTPCQAFSVAGARGSLSDERGNLTLTYAHLLDRIDDARRRAGRPAAVCLWENVPGVLNTDDNAFGCFLGEMAGEDGPLSPPGGRWTDAGLVRGPRRAIAWRVLDAQYFGLAQRRRRVFVVASAREGFRPEAILFELEGLRRDTPPSRGTGERAASTLEASVGSRGYRDNGDGTANLIAEESRVTGHGEGFPEVAHTLRGEGFDATEDGTGRGIPLWPEIAGTLQCNGKAAGSATSQDADQGTIVAFDTTQITSRENRCNPQPGDPCHPLAAGAHAPAVAFATSGDGYWREGHGPLRGREQDSHENLVMQQGQVSDETLLDAIGFNARQDPDFWRERSGPLDTDGTTQAVAFQTGNIARGAGAEPSETVFPTLKADHGRGLSDQHPCVAFKLRGREGGAMPEVDPDGLAVQRAASGGSSRSYIGTAMQVRRLTPRECERLQGFPDDYTLIPSSAMKRLEADMLAYLKATRPDLSDNDLQRLAKDGPRYKALGNSMAVPVIEWLGRRVEAHLSTL